MSAFGLLMMVVVAVYLLSSTKILPEYERGVVFRLGRLLPQPKGPGVVLVFWPVDTMVRISLRPQTLELPPQDFGTRDDVTLTLGVIVSLRVLEPRLAVVEVANYQSQAAQAAESTLRSVVAESTCDEVREHLGELGPRVQRLLDPVTARWGVMVESVMVKQPDGPGSTPHVPRVAS